MKFSNILSVILFLVIIAGCTKTGGKIDEADGVRLSHQTNATAVSSIISGYTNGFELRDAGDFTDIGNYPALPHVYYYSIGWQKQLAEDVFAYRSLKAEAGGGDDPKEEILSTYFDFHEISLSAIGQSPYSNVFVLKQNEFSKKYWGYIMFIDLDHINQDYHIIHLSGSYSPDWDEYESKAPEPPSDAQAISTMLSLTEPIRKP